MIVTQWIRSLFRARPAEPDRAAQERALLQAELAALRATLDARLEEMAREAGRLSREQSRALTALEAQGSSLEELEGAWSEDREQRRDEAAALRETLATLQEQTLLSVAQQLMPVADALAHSIRAVQQGRGGAAAAGGEPQDGWTAGLLLVERRLQAVLAQAGIAPIPAVGQPFDPHRHLATATVCRDDLPNGAIVAEERRGYLHGERVLRPGEVVVVRNAPGTHGSPPAPLDDEQ